MDDHHMQPCVICDRGCVHAVFWHDESNTHRGSLYALEMVCATGQRTVGALRHQLLWKLCHLEWSQVQRWNMEEHMCLFIWNIQIYNSIQVGI